MKKKLRLISAIIILSMIFPLFSGIIQPVFAAEIPIEVYVDSYSKSTATVNIHWDAISNVTGGTIEYHVPNGATYDTMRVPIDITKNSASITDIKSDIIYDFKVMLTDSSGQTFVGQQYFLAQISFSAKYVDQQFVDVPGGGVESGVLPAIKVTWNMPKVFNNSSLAMVNANEALSQIDGSITKLNFSISMRSDTSHANIEVRMGSGGLYTAAVSGDTDSARYSNVKFDSGKLYFYIFGLKDDDSTMPAIGDIRSGVAEMPEDIINAGDNDYVLPHPEVRPGTIYKMSINALFLNSADKYVSAVADGLSESPLQGAVDYAYTPVRFQLTKDTFDNVYVRIYRINKGGVTMPRLYYEIQTSNVPSDQDTSWTTRKKLDDTYFNGEFAITAITGINSKNTVYYRVVVKSDGVSDKIQSLILPYTMKDDDARPPVPKEISVVSVDLALPPSGSGDTSSNITITWDKPSNWDQIKGHVDKDIYFHFLLNIAPKDMDLNPSPSLTANGKDYGIFPVKYRLVKYISANSDKIKENGSKLVYTLNGFDLFKGEDEQGNLYNIANSEGYPTHLLPNKTYYLQMYTTLAVDKGETQDSLKMSEKSLVCSFTTLSPTGRDVPIPTRLEWVETKINPATVTDPADAIVKIRFDDLSSGIVWDNYTTKHHEDDAVIYDLYMSTRTEPNSFWRIDTTEQTSGLVHDVNFTKQTLGGNTDWVYATINKFTEVNNVSKFGKSLSPNSTYYFMIKVRLKLVNDDDKESVETVLLPVTTPRGEVTEPDDDYQRPVSPTDFAIALDANGNPMVTGQTVTFEWTATESDAAYELIATSKKVDADTSTSDGSISTDPVYTSFTSTFGNKDGNIDGDPDKLTLDPNSSLVPENFTYDSKTKKCRYTINTWLYPNKIYYFSLRAEVPDSEDILRSSVWVSIPVTTSLIEVPTGLQVVNDCQVGFYWFDTKAQMTAQNYNVMLKGPGESSFKLLEKSQYTIVKDGTIYYGRIMKLKADSQYSIKVVRTTDNKEFDTITKTTRNDYYQIDVKWQGYEIDPFSGFEIAIKTEDDSDYALLNNSTDLEQYVDMTGNTYAYYIEKSNSNVNTNYYTYTARIKLAPTKLPDGTVQNSPLKPNTKYYIKVRAVKTDSSDKTALTPSKYAGPVETRTEFSQDDYDDDDNDTEVTAKFLDMLEKLEQNVYWDVNKKNGVINKILVKDEKLINLLQGYGNFSCTIDISQAPDYITSDEIYMAEDVLEAMKTANKSVIIKTRGVEYTIRPDTFSSDMEEFKSAEDITDEKDIYIKINNVQNKEVNPAAPSNTAVSTQMNVFAAQAVVSRQTRESINALIKDKLYNDKTGIIQQKLETLKSPNNTNTKGDADDVNTYLNQMLEDVKSELSYYIEDTVIGINSVGGIFDETFTIAKFNSPMGVKMPYKANTVSNPYVIYGNTGNWNKLTQNLKYENGYLSYYVAGPGKYTIFSSRNVADTVPGDSSAKPYISKLSANYDLTSVFPGVDVSFNGDLNITVKEGILLYELISESQADSQADAKAKAKTYGLDKIINVTNLYRNITRQEAAAIVIKLYCQRTGSDYNKLKASYPKTIKDDGKISEKYAAPVYMCLQMKLMTLDSGNNFNPSDTINRSGMVMVIQKMLEA